VREQSAVPEGYAHFDTDTTQVLLSVYSDNFTFKDKPFQTVRFVKPKRFSVCEKFLSRIGFNQFGEKDLEIPSSRAE